MASLKVVPIPSPPFTLKLSCWDKRAMPIYSKRILCFEVPNGDIEHITNLLLAALRSTVEELPFLAGSVAPCSKDAPWLLDLLPTGSTYLETQDLTREMNFSKLQQSGFSSSLLSAEKLCPFPLPVYVQDDPADVCRFRATFINGGLLLAVQVAHTVCDGRGISDVLKVFADKFCQAQRGELKNVVTAVDDGKGPGDPYTFDRTAVFSGFGAHGSIENHPCWMVPQSRTHGTFSGAKTICANVHINIDSLRALKEAASPSGTAGEKPGDAANDVTWISTQDAVAALIWRSIMLARAKAGIISAHALCQLSEPVDCRTRMDLQQPYHGNAFYGILASLSLADLAAPSDHPSSPHIPGLQAAARAIRRELRAVTTKRCRDLLGYIERTEMDHPIHFTVMPDLLTRSMFLTSYFGFEMHELDFGEALGGHIQAFRVPPQGIAPGVPIILPRLPDGSYEFVINEQEAVMKCLDEDEVFGRFVTQVA